MAVHLEPYGGRSVASTVADIAYLRTYGITTFYVYRPFDLAVGDWAAAKTALHAGGVKLFAQTALVGSATAAGFDGVYTYDILTYSGDKFRRLCTQAHAMHLICAPSVGPGYDARRGSDDPRLKSRRNGATYDAMWRAAIASGADRVTITSYNEWHEGTQIEPAAPAAHHGRYRYLSYDGAWGLHGVAAENAYLTADALLVGRLPQHVAGAAEEQGFVDRRVVDSAQLRMVEVDDGVGPRLESQRRRALVGAEA